MLSYREMPNTPQAQAADPSRASRMSLRVIRVIRVIRVPPSSAISAQGVVGGPSGIRPDSDQNGLRHGRLEAVASQWVT